MRKKERGITLPEVLLYTSLFSILAIITIYTFLLMNRIYRFTVSKSEEFERISRYGRDIPILIQSLPLPDGSTPAYRIVTNASERTPGYISEVAFWRVNRNTFNPLNLNSSMFQEWRIGFRSSSPNSQPFNDGFIDIFPRGGVVVNSFRGVENVQFIVFNGGVFSDRGDSLQLIITVFERKFTRRLQTAYVVTNR